MIPTVNASCLRCPWQRSEIGSEVRGTVARQLSEVVSTELEEAGQYLQGEREGIKRQSRSQYRVVVEVSLVNKWNWACVVEIRANG